MTREIVTLDVTEIEDREWTWSVGAHKEGKLDHRFYAAYVFWDDPEAKNPCSQGLSSTAQGALDNAYREALACHCAVCYEPLGKSNGDCCSIQCETEREARRVLA